MHSAFHQPTETSLTVVLLTRVKYGSTAIANHTLSIPQEGLAGRFHLAFVSIRVVRCSYVTDCVLSQFQFSWALSVPIAYKDLLFIKVLHFGCFLVVYERRRSKIYRKTLAISSI